MSYKAYLFYPTSVYRTGSEVWEYCGEYCPMLNCRCKPMADENDEEDFCFNKDRKYPWFTGKCYLCGNKIDFPEQAYRVPFHSGSWIGCYCSWQCAAKSSIPFQGYYQDAQAYLIKSFERYDKELAELWELNSSGKLYLPYHIFNRIAYYLAPR